MISFGGVFLLLNGLATLYFFTVSSRDHKLFREETRYQAQTGPFDLLIIGNSRSRLDIDTAYLENAYQFCSGGESTVQSYYKLKRIFSEPNPPKSVLVSIGSPGVNRQRPAHTQNTFYWSDYVDYLELANESDEFDTYLSTWLRSKATPYYEYPYIRISFALGDFKPGSAKEYPGATEQERFEQAINALELLCNAKHFNDSTALIYLHKIVDLCEAENAPLYLVKFPVTSYYQAAVDTLFTQGRFKAFPDTFGGPNTTIIDFTKVFFDRPDLFKDVGHLNEEGRVILTQMLRDSMSMSSDQP